MKHTISNSLIIFSFILMVAGCVMKKPSRKMAKIWAGLSPLVIRSFLCTIPVEHYQPVSSQIYDYDNK